MTDTGRTTTVSLGGDTGISYFGEFQKLTGEQKKEPLNSASEAPTCQDFRNVNGANRSSNISSHRNGNDLAQLPHASLLQNRYDSRSRLRILVLNDKSLPLPQKLLEQVQREDPQAIIRNNWNSVCEMLADDWRTAPHIILGVSPDCTPVTRRLKELRNLRASNNDSPWPVYFAMPRGRQSGRSRFDIERLGGYFLHLFDAPDHLRIEIEQIRLMRGHLKRVLPTWFIVYEGHGETLRAVVYFVHRKKLIRVRGSDRQIATLAVFLKNNGLERSFSGWQAILANDPLFESAGGGFTVPSIGTIKMYLHRDFPKSLQQAFDECQSGFLAKHVIEVRDPGTHMTHYRIRGEWEASRK